MIFQNALPIVPQGAVILSRNLAVIEDSERVVFYHSAAPIFSYRVGDKLGMRTAQAILTEHKLVKPTALAKVMGVNPSTIHRNRRKYRDGGIDALRDSARVRLPYKFDTERQERAQALLDEGYSNRAAAKDIGISPGTIDNAVKSGLLKKPAGRKASHSEKLMVGPWRRSVDVTSSSAGIAVARHEERILTSVGNQEEAKPVFESAEAVRHAGVLLCLPALMEQGLLHVAMDVYGKLQKGYFGLQSVFLILAFCALLRIKTVEQVSNHAPGELGRLLGLDRAPEVKTLRRKLEELGVRRRARDYAHKLAQRWAGAQPEALGFLYVDGHVRAYNGRKHVLPKAFVPRRRLCMPATTDTWVNDSHAQPLFFVTAPANDGLLTMMEGGVLPEVRRLVGADRRVTFIFDREGWSPDIFRKWKKRGFDVLTYRKGNYEAWPTECFFETKVKVGNRIMTYRLGERSIQLIQEKKNRKGDITQHVFWAREIRRLCDSGHQTSVITTRQDLGVVELALRMFSRWTQENFFHYMRREYGLDHHPCHSVEPADPDRLAPNPMILKKKAVLKQLQREIANYEREFAEQAMGNSVTLRTAKPRRPLSETEIKERIRSLMVRRKALKSEMKTIPKKVPLSQIMEESLIVKLEEDRKVLTDCIKMVAYRAESSMTEDLGPFLIRHDEEGRSFLKSVFTAPADLIPDEKAGTLTVRFHSMATPRENSALLTLCELYTKRRIRFPGTRLRLIYEGPKAASSIVRCQEP